MHKPKEKLINTSDGPIIEHI
uniref:Uncharacterized protein n=1 Tax=Arundo donax TaxID=35708 RepID=A0A0A9EKD0_ARUDO